MQAIYSGGFRRHLQVRGGRVDAGYFPEALKLTPTSFANLMDV